MKTKRVIIVASTFALLGLSGCAQKQMSSNDGEMQAKRIAELESKLSQADREVSSLQAENMSLKDGKPVMQDNMSMTNDLLPPNAKPGECYARVLTPAAYKNNTKQVLKKAASEKIEVINAVYEPSEQRVMVKEAGEVLKTVPAVYDWVEERVMVEPEKTTIVTFPATYKSVSEQVLIKPAYTTWKKGRGPIEKINDSTGEIMCLVEVPAEYNTITQRVLDQEAYTQTKVIPAVYKNVRKKVMVKPPQVIKQEIPAEYSTVKVNKLVTPASQRKIAIPAEYGSVTERSLVTPASLAWQSILCETNTTPRIISDIQRALNAAGYSAGDADGVMGAQTMSALRSYQKAQGIAEGSITMQSLKKLGVL